MEIPPFHFSPGGGNGEALRSSPHRLRGGELERGGIAACGVVDESGEAPFVNLRA